MTLRERNQKVQNRFLQLVGFRVGYRYLEVSLGVVADRLTLPSLQTRREVQDVVFLYMIINGLVDCRDLLDTTLFHVPLFPRSRDLFSRRYYNTNYAKNSTMTHIQQLGNAVSPHVDFFASSERSLKLFCIF